jgi:hypothetical protein
LHSGKRAGGGELHRLGEAPVPRELEHRLGTCLRASERADGVLLHLRHGTPVMTPATLSIARALPVATSRFSTSAPRGPATATEKMS